MKLYERPRSMFRWVVEWNRPRPGHMTGNTGCEHHGPDECFDWHERAFPREALALAFARDAKRCPSFDGEVRVHMQGWSAIRGDVGEWNTLETAWISQSEACK